MNRPALYAFLLVALVVIAAVVLTVTGHDVPSWMQLLAGVSAGGGAGMAVPNRAAQ